MRQIGAQKSFQMLKRLHRRMLISFAFGIAVVFALGLYADVRDVLLVMRTFPWHLLPVILLLTCMNYLLRFAKWHFYLGIIRSRVPVTASLLIFLSGFAMALTPGKVGELLKSYLLRREVGTPMARSAPIMLAERLTDGIALLLLGSVGLLRYGKGWEGLAIICAGAIAVVVLIQSRRLSLVSIAALERVPMLKRFAPHIRTAYESSYELFRIRPLLAAIGLGLLSWSGECVAFYVVLQGLDVPAQNNFLLLINAAFILASSTLVGSASLLPGGLGIADGGITGLLQALLHTPRDVSVAATLLIRFCTLWFGVAIGLVALSLEERRSSTSLTYAEEIPAV